MRRTALTHRDGAQQFYRELQNKGVSVRVGMEASGHSRWFERLLGELNYELWVGDPAQIRAKQVRKQKNDRRDAQHLLKLMLEDNFPRIWVPTPENRDVRQLVLHRHHLVGMRTRVRNQLQAIAMNEGLRRKRGRWGEKGRTQLESLSLPAWTSRRRQELLDFWPNRWLGRTEVQALMVTSEPLVEAAVRQCGDRALGIILPFCFSMVWCTPGFERGTQQSHKQNLLTKERSSAELRFASFPLPLWGLGGLSRIEMNALRAPLTALPTRRKKCVYFSLDTADDFIDGFSARHRRPRLIQKPTFRLTTDSQGIVSTILP